MELHNLAQSHASSWSVGIRTDGASPNIAAAGMKGLVEKELPWIFWIWCLDHRLELAVQDALKHATFEYYRGDASSIVLPV